MKKKKKAYLTKFEYLEEKIESLNAIKYDPFVWDIWGARDEDEMLKEQIELFTRLISFKKEELLEENFEFCHQIDSFLIDYIATTSFYLQDRMESFCYTFMLAVWEEIEKFGNLNFNYEEKVEKVREIREEISDFLQLQNIEN